eukprot:COSAG01_NODE_55524_length_324_cov_1.151111_1_plen_40_part_10
MHAFLTEVMKGNDPPEVHEKDESGNIYTYIKTFGIFGLLR